MTDFNPSMEWLEAQETRLAEMKANHASRESNLTAKFIGWRSKERQALERQSDSTLERLKKTHAAHLAYGLVVPSISHRASVVVYAGMTKVRMPAYKPPPVKPPHRGIIRGMSSKSRKRMMEAIAQWLNFDKGRSYFITITYHEEWGVNYKAWKRDVDVFIKRMRRKFEDVGGLWKLEFQQRGAPHYHLLISGVNEVLSEMIKWVTDNWADIAHENSVHKGKYATNVRRIYSRFHAQNYCSKYMTKDVPLYVNPDDDGVLELIPTGRIWAFFGNVDRSPILEFQTSESQAKEWRRGVVVHLIKMGSRYADRFGRMDERRSWSIMGIGAGEGNEDITLWRDFIRIRYELANMDIDR